MPSTSSSSSLVSEAICMLTELGEELGTYGSDGCSAP